MKTSHDPLATRAGAEKDVAFRRGVVTDERGAAGADRFQRVFARVVLQAAAADRTQEIRADGDARSVRRGERRASARRAGGRSSRWCDDRHQRGAVSLLAGALTGGDDGLEFLAAP